MRNLGVETTWKRGFGFARFPNTSCIGGNECDFIGNETGNESVSTLFYLGRDGNETQCMDGNEGGNEGLFSFPLLKPIQRFDNQALMRKKEKCSFPKKRSRF